MLLIYSFEFLFVSPFDFDIYKYIIIFVLQDLIGHRILVIQHKLQTARKTRIRTCQKASRINKEQRSIEVWLPYSNFGPNLSKDLPGQCSIDECCWTGADIIELLCLIFSFDRQFVKMSS